MNKKAFTLVELIAVIVIISMIVSIALVSVSKYRQDALKREKTALRHTIIGAFQNYRVDNKVEKEEKIGVSL
jgi:prepilin-type N-terminal cleavage/methylation domain-containing protein